jgi:hypothetical protein
MMNRRASLKLFAAAGPVAAVAPTYFFAPVGGWKTRTPAGDAFAQFLARMNNTDSVETAAGRQFWYMHPAHKPLIDELFEPVPKELWAPELSADCIQKCNHLIGKYRAEWIAEMVRAGKKVQPIQWI